MSGREEVLRRVRRALDGARRVEHPGVAPSPGATLDDAARAELFAERVADYRAVVDRLYPAGLPLAVTAALSGTARVVVPPGIDPHWLGALTGTEVLVDDGALSAYDLDRVDAVVTAAALGIAVTGTVVLDHAPDQGRRALTLVPDRHVCVVRESQLVDDVPDSLAPLRAAVDAGRPLTWISGPSATSDIELERVEGVHGPRTLHVLLVRDVD